MDELSPQDHGEIVAKIISARRNRADEDILRLSYLPDKNELIEVISLIRQVVFPGYFDGNGSAVQRRDLSSLVSEIK